MPLSSGGEAIVGGLVAHGVDTVFGLPGAQIYGLFDAFQQAQLKVIGARHEQACGYMAFGYARATGKPGVFSVVPGPGVLNAERGFVDRLWRERARALPDRTGAISLSRQRPRPFARNAGPACDAAHLREMGRPYRISGQRSRVWSRARSRKCCRGVAARFRWKCHGTCSRKRSRSAPPRCWLHSARPRPIRTGSNRRRASSRQANRR